MNEQINAMAINDECLRLYLHNNSPSAIIYKLFPNSHCTYIKEKIEALVESPLRFISNLDMAHRKVLYKNAIEVYLTEATNRVMNSTY